MNTKIVEVLAQAAFEEWNQILSIEGNSLLTGWTELDDEGRSKQIRRSVGIIRTLSQAGYVIVPRAPNRTMSWAGEQEIEKYLGDLVERESINGLDLAADRSYQAMLTAFENQDDDQKT